MDSKKKKTSWGEDMVTDKEFIDLKEKFEKLHLSYQKFHQFGNGLENGIHAFKIGFHCLSDTDLNNIRAVFRNILFQWGNNSDIEKEESIKGIGEYCKLLVKSESKEYVKNFFESLMEMPPDPSDDYCAPRRHCKNIIES